MRVFINEDWCHYLWTRKNQHITEKELKDFVYQYKNTTVSDILFNVNGTVSTSPSKIFDTFVGKYLVKEEHGIKVDYTNTPAALAYDLFVTQNLNVYEIWFNACKEIGINPWLSIRMNDLHYSHYEAEVRKSTMVEKFRNEYISSHRGVYSYFDKCLDYSKKSVRDIMFDYIVEQVSMYDVYGVELDFTREPFCFACGMEEEGQSIMLDFIKSIRTVINEIGASRNKKIVLSILGQANPISALKTGFDFSEIAKNGLIDLYVASPRWETINTDIPIETWKKLLPSNVMLGCSQGLIMRPSIYGIQKMCDVAMDMGQAVANAHRGCDIIYLFNHFDNREPGLEPFGHENDIRKHENIRYIYENIGNVENYQNWVRRIPVSYDDFVARCEPIVSKLPISSRVSAFRIPCGKIPTEQEILINVVIKEEVDPKTVQVFVNTKQAEYLSDVKENIVWEDGITYTYKVKVKTDKLLGVEVIMDTPKTICYVDAIIFNQN